MFFEHSERTIGQGPHVSLTETSERADTPPACHVSGELVLSPFVLCREDHTSFVSYIIGGREIRGIESGNAIGRRQLTKPPKKKEGVRGRGKGKGGRG